MLFLLHSLNICATIPLDASVAQLVEQLIRNQQVAGSSPVTSSKQRNAFCLPKGVSLFIQAAGLVYHHARNVRVYHRRTCAAYIITRQRVYHQPVGMYIITSSPKSGLLVYSPAA